MKIIFALCFLLPVTVLAVTPPPRQPTWLDQHPGFTPAPPPPPKFVPYDGYDHDQAGLQKLEKLNAPK